MKSHHLPRSHAKPAAREAVLGFTIAFCFLPSALCLMAFLLLTYFRSVR